MKNRIFKIVTLVAGAYHVILAVAGLLCPADMAVKVVTMAFGITLELGPQIALILKFASVYMLVFGIMLLILAYNPIKYRAIAIPALVLFGIRLINRIILFSTLTAAGMSVTRNIIGTAHIFFFFLAILLCLPWKQTADQEHEKTEDSQ